RHEAVGVGVIDRLVDLGEQALGVALGLVLVDRRAGRLGRGGRRRGRRATGRDEDGRVSHDHLRSAYGSSKLGVVKSSFATCDGQRSVERAGAAFVCTVSSTCPVARGKRRGGAV